MPVRKAEILVSEIFDIILALKEEEYDIIPELLGTVAAPVTRDEIDVFMKSYKFCTSCSDHELKKVEKVLVDWKEEHA